ncbi:hypothetical protein V8E36_009247 [Tilletia maclaganii]
MPVVQISSALPPLISGGTSSLFSDAVSRPSPPTRRRRRTPLFDDSDDDQQASEQHTLRHVLSSSSNAGLMASPISSTSTTQTPVSVSAEDEEEDFGDEGAHTLSALSASKSRRRGGGGGGGAQRYDSIASLAGSDPGVGDLTAPQVSAGAGNTADHRQRRSSLIDTSRSDVAGPASASSSSLKVVSRASSLRIVSRSSGGPAGSSVVDHLWEGGQGASADGGELSTSANASGSGSGPGRSSSSGSGSGEGSMSLSSLGGGGVRAFGSSLGRASSMSSTPGSSSAGLISSPSTKQRSLASSSTLSQRTRPPVLESINTSIPSTASSSLSDREPMPSSAGGYQSSSRTSTSSSEAAAFSLRSIGGSHRNSTDSSISSLNDELASKSREGGGLGGSFARSSFSSVGKGGKGRLLMQQQQPKGRVLERSDDSDRTSIAEVRDMEAGSTDGDGDGSGAGKSGLDGAERESNADTETDSPDTVQAENVTWGAGLKMTPQTERAVQAESDPSTFEPTTPASPPMASSAPLTLPNSPDLSVIDFRRASHALQIPLIKDALRPDRPPDSTESSADGQSREERGRADTAHMPSAHIRTATVGSDGSALFSFGSGAGADPVASLGKHLDDARLVRHSRSPRRFSDRARPSDFSASMDPPGVPLLAQEAQADRQSTSPRRTGTNVESVLGTSAPAAASLSPSITIPAALGGSNGSVRLRAAGLAPLSAYPGSSASSSSLIGPSTGTGAAVSGASYAYGYGYGGAGAPASQLQQPQHPAAAATTPAHMTAFGDAYGEAHLPRRHSGIFLQRTRSALSIGRRPDVNTSFGVGGHRHGHGRAGARKAGASSGVDASGGGDHASQTDLQADFWASAPFSALEARNRALALAAQGTGTSASSSSSGPGLGFQRHAGGAIGGNRGSSMMAVSQPASPRLQAVAAPSSGMFSPTMLRSGFIGGFNFTPLNSSTPIAAPVASGSGLGLGSRYDTGAGGGETGRFESAVESGVAGRTVNFTLGPVPARLQAQTGAIADSSQQASQRDGLPLSASSLSTLDAVNPDRSASLSDVPSSNVANAIPIPSVDPGSSGEGINVSATSSRSIPPSRRSSRLALPPLEERRALTPDEIEEAQQAGGPAIADTFLGSPLLAAQQQQRQQSLGQIQQSPHQHSHPHSHHHHHHFHALSGPAGLSPRPAALSPSATALESFVGGGGGGGRPISWVGLPASSPLTAEPSEALPFAHLEAEASASATGAAANRPRLSTHSDHQQQQPLHSPGGSVQGHGARPGLARAMTNVQYTPTTEEWSRWLARQGVVGLGVSSSSSSSLNTGGATGRGRTRSSRVSGGVAGSEMFSRSLSASMSSLLPMSGSGSSGGAPTAEPTGAGSGEGRPSSSSLLAPSTSSPVRPTRLASLTFSSSNSSATLSSASSASETRRSSVGGGEGGGQGGLTSPRESSQAVGSRDEARADAGESGGAALQSPFEQDTPRFAGATLDPVAGGGDGDGEQDNEAIGMGEAGGISSVGVMERIKALSRNWSASAITSVLSHDLARSLLGNSTADEELDLLRHPYPSFSTSIPTQHHETGISSTPSPPLPVQAHSAQQQQVSPQLRAAQHHHFRAHTQRTISAATHAANEIWSSSSAGSSPSTASIHHRSAHSEDEDEDEDDDEGLHALQAAVSRSPSVSGRSGGVGVGGGGGIASLSSGVISSSSPLVMPQAQEASPHAGFSSANPSPSLSPSPSRSPEGVSMTTTTSGFLEVPSRPGSAVSPTNSTTEPPGRAADGTLIATAEGGGPLPDHNALTSIGHQRLSPPIARAAASPLPIGQGGPGTTRSIDDFVVVDEIGRGAYGLVKKVRLRGADGRPTGEPFIVKFIIKSRILADCWRRHKLLGPIPIEIHVLDQLRRIPFSGAENSRLAPWAPSKLFRSSRPGRSDLQEQPPPPPAPSAPASTLSKPGAETTGVDPLRGRTGSLASHPALCEMLEFFEDHEFYYLVMPCFGRGQDLFDFVEAAPEGLPSAHVRSILGQVADALRHLHANNIVHRDIKDENVILDGEGNVQLIDFGAAAHVRPGRLFDTFSGTLDYAAAEILRGEKYGGKEQDVWALGVVAYVLLCGETPFWNGEEAIAGLSKGTRAADALEDRCSLHLQQPHPQQQQRPRAAEEEDDEEREELPASPLLDAVDLDDGQADGGGRVADGADLIQQCLQLELGMRPTAEQVCSHRFLVGRSGWAGPCGWTTLSSSSATPLP